VTLAHGRGSRSLVQGRQGVVRGLGSNFFIKHRLRIRIVRIEYPNPADVKRVGLVVFISNLPDWWEMHLLVSTHVAEAGGGKVNRLLHYKAFLRSTGVDAGMLTLSPLSKNSVDRDLKPGETFWNGIGEFAGKSEVTVDSGRHTSFLLAESAENDPVVRVHGTGWEEGGQPETGPVLGTNQDFEFILRVDAENPKTQIRTFASRHYRFRFVQWYDPRVGVERYDKWYRVLTHPPWKENSKFGNQFRSRKEKRVGEYPGAIR
jgi:hypothetical protein